MQRVFLSLLLFCMAISAHAQFMRAEELEAYAKERYGERWVDAAANLAGSLSLDKNNSLTYVQVIDCGKQTKEQLYVSMNYWFTASFNDANSVINLNDKESGVIIAQGLVSNVAEHTGGSNSYAVSIRPIIRVDIKDQKIRVTYTIQNYDVSVVAGGGIVAAMTGAIPVKRAEKWPIEQHYPFIAKDRVKKTCSKALIMAHAYSNVIMDKIEEAAKNGLVGNENDDW